MLHQGAVDEDVAPADFTQENTLRRVIVPIAGARGESPPKRRCQITTPTERMTATTSSHQTSPAEYQDCNFSQVCNSLVARPPAIEARTAHAPIIAIRMTVEYCFDTRKMLYYLRPFEVFDGSRDSMSLDSSVHARQHNEPFEPRSGGGNIARGGAGNGRKGRPEAPDPPARRHACSWRYDDCRAFMERDELSTSVWRIGGALSTPLASTPRMGE